MVELFETELRESYQDNESRLNEGYEGGYSDINKIREIKVELNVHTEDYNGLHDETGKSNTKAYLLDRLPNQNYKDQSRFKQSQFQRRLDSWS